MELRKWGKNAQFVFGARKTLFLFSCFYQICLNELKAFFILQSSWLSEDTFLAISLFVCCISYRSTYDYINKTTTTTATHQISAIKLLYEEKNMVVWTVKDYITTTESKGILIWTLFLYGSDPYTLHENIYAFPIVEMRFYWCHALLFFILLLRFLFCFSALMMIDIQSIYSICNVWCTVHSTIQSFI